jgi:pimeloyl-ACP methyl ester carboxylesterase
VDTREGQIHYATCGDGEPVLFLHQTPRSWDEYRDVLPLVGRKYRAIAMDTVGFGDSYRLDCADSVEVYGRGALAFIDALDLPRVCLVGHHTGGAIAIEVAATQPSRVNAVVLSSTPYIDAGERERRKVHRPIDQVEFSEDGSHLVDLWRRRQSFYPTGRPDLLHRLVIDGLRVLDRIEEGHIAVGRYHMEQKVGLIQAPTLVLVGSADQYAAPFQHALAAAIVNSQEAVIEGGMVPMVDQLPEQFADVVLRFLDSVI